ncbi:MAG: hypothetical protein M3Q98_14270 [Actinomycetota bacterium]|nr:hypothetical protein [Actinomycetota bacterium]
MVDTIVARGRVRMQVTRRLWIVRAFRRRVDDRLGRANLNSPWQICPVESRETQ